MPAPAAALSPCILLFHIADDGLATIVHMDVLDADKLLPAIPHVKLRSRPAPRRPTIHPIRRPARR
jgi:hypothetical protein